MHIIIYHKRGGGGGGGGVTATHKSTTRVPKVRALCSVCMWAGLICKHMHKEIAHTGAEMPTSVKEICQYFKLRGQNE